MPISINDDHSLIRKACSLLEANPDLDSGERVNLARIITLFISLENPPDPYGLFPRYKEYHERLFNSLEKKDAHSLETDLLTLYSHLHGFEAPYTPSERERINQTGGYWCHAGGLTPIIKAEPFVHAGTISADYGAGNGLQLMLLQKLFPHAKSIQIELSGKMVESGRLLQQWLSIPQEKVEWHIIDIMNFPAYQIDFLYLYRPVRPEGNGRLFYEKLAKELKEEKSKKVIFSIADCLKNFIQPEFREFYNDGHLTCFDNSPLLNINSRSQT